MEDNIIEDYDIKNNINEIITNASIIEKNDNFQNNNTDENYSDFNQTFNVENTKLNNDEKKQEQYADPSFDPTMEEQEDEEVEEQEEEKKQEQYADPCTLDETIWLQEEEQEEPEVEQEEEQEEEPEVEQEEHDDFLHFGPDQQILNEAVDSKHNEIMSWAYSNMMNIDDNIIKLIDYCYLKNLQYDDEPIDTIRYTIRTIFAEGLDYDLKNLISNIFSYGMMGINYVFNENFEILNDLLSSELKRILRRGMFLNIFSQMILNHNGGIGQMEDIKLILTKEELDKIPVNIYKDISLELREKNDNCPVCREEYHDNDNVRTLGCGHVFHTDCVDNWLTNHSHKCPCCRQTSGNYKPNI